MIYACDLHIHSALSPCASDDMTPNNIINMAKLKGLSMIAVTDHHSMGNYKAVETLGRQKGILVVPGIEVESREKVHVLCYFPSGEALWAFQGQIEPFLPDIPTDPRFFGRQLLMDVHDEVVGEYPKRLSSSLELSIGQIQELTMHYQGVMVPAHINRKTNSLLCRLGIIPSYLRITAVEVSPHAPAPVCDTSRFHVLTSSDAHSLGMILEAESFLELHELSSRAFIDSIRRAK